MDKLLEYLNGERGRKSALAARLKISPSAISMWDQVPTERVSAVSSFTGIPPHELRPDLAALFSPAPHPEKGEAA
jgi:DNA-binding transcriptional regulator YdaS (Cro superfamily)